MTPERWRKVEELFHAAVQLPPGARPGYLDRESAGDEELRAEIESLLAAHSASGQLLEQPPSQLAAELLSAYEPRRGQLAGRTLGKYRVEQRIGVGGMGEVYRALDVTLDRKVALKILPQGSGAESMRRFAMEARAASAVNHPHIATIYEIGESDGAVYIAMELVEGQTLAEVAKPVAPGTLLDWAIQMAEALQAAHAQGVIHRDIKPGNVMIAAGRIKVLDFGLAKAPRADGVQTEAGVVMGTVQYMSPEQLRGRPVDSRTDLFSLGALLFELAAGVSPFLGAISTETIARILNDVPREAGESIEPGLRRIVYRCLEKDAARRYSSAGELRTDLLALRTGSMGPGRRAMAVGAGLAIVAGIGWWMRPRHGGAPIRSLAVLPLANLSSDQSQEFFADGMTEALTSALARIRQLRVISRSSAMQFKNTRAPLREVAGKLGADAVIEGSVLRGAGGKVRITVQLIDAATDTHLWSRDYEREARDVIEIQREVARDVAREVRLQLTPRASAAVSAEALESYLRGRYHWNRRTGPELKQAGEHFETAIRIAPDYADAHIGLADTHLLLTPYAGLTPSETYPKAERLARRALQIDAGSGEAHATLGVIEHEYNWNHDAAREHFVRAMELEPNYAPARQWYAEFLTRLREPEKALGEIREARQIDPLSLIVRAVHGWVLHHAGRNSEAVALLGDVLAQDARFVPAYGYLGQSLSAMRRHGEAVSRLETAIELSGGNSRYVSSLAVALARAGRMGEARQKLRELQQLASRSPVPAVQVAAPLVALGDDTEAWRWLERAAGERGVWMLFLNFDPLYERLRPQPRFQALLGQAGFR